MDSNVFWLFFSFSYIAILACVGFVLYRYLHFKSESVRKFIHILTSNWIFIVLYKMDDPTLMLLGPLAFVFINSAFVYLGLGKYLGMDDRKRDNGLIYYPFSVFLLVFLYTKGIIHKENVVIGVLVMGWGDGLAAVVGTYFGRHRYKIYSRYKKSVEGTLTMFVVSIIVLLVFSSVAWYWIILVAIFSTMLENLTPLGFDNITVPILTALVLEVLCRL